MADISNLNLQAAEPLDLDNYKTAGGGFSLPPKGRYTLRTTESFTADSFGSSRAGALTAAIDPTIVAPTHEGYTLRFTRVSNKRFQRSHKLVSQLGDYLKACGVGGVLSNDQDAANAVEATAGMIFEADLDWRAYDKSSGRSVDGMDNFPKDDAGNPQPFILSENEKDDQGDPKRVWANLQIVRYVPKG